MSRASNSLRLSDVIATPIKLKYTASYNECTLEEFGITVLTGVNGPVTITGSIPQETLNYRSVKQLYYANVLTGSYLTTTSSFDVSIQSTAASGTFDSDNRYFPTQSGGTVRILSIPRGVFGEKISRHSFSMTSSAYRIVDDGNGNLVDVLNSPVGVNIGNIIYPQGMVIITNSDYLEIFPYPPVAYNDSASFKTGDSPKLVNILANDDPGTGTLLTSSVVLFDGDVALFTNNLNGTVTLNTTDVGTYTTYYTVQSQIPDPCPMTSNSASITVTVTSSDCALAGTLVVPPTTTTTSTTTSTTTVTPTTTTSTTTVPPTTTTTTTSTTTTTTTAACTNVLNPSIYGGVDIDAACANTSSRGADAYACLFPPFIGFAIGTQWFLDEARTIPYPTGSYAVHNPSLSNDNTWVIFGSGGIVQSTGSCVPPTTTTSTTTSTTTVAPTTTSTTTSTTTVPPTTTSTTTVAPTTTSTTTSTTTVPPTTTSTTTSTTTPEPTTTTTSTTTSTTTPPPTTTTTSTTTSTTTASGQLNVYSKYLNTAPPGNLQYSINLGTNINAGPVTTTSCDYMFTISGLQIGDSVDFTNTATFSIGGSTSACPDGPGGFGCVFSYSVLSTGPQNVYITIDGANSC